MKNSENAFTAIETLLAVTVTLVIAIVGWHVLGSKEDGPHLSPSGTPATNLPKGDANNTYAYRGTVFPDLPSGYKTVHRDPKASESFYITLYSKDQVRTEVESVCRAHGFIFSKSTPTNGQSIECSSKVATWTFSILSASNIIDEPWYSSIAPIDESALAKSMLLTVASRQAVVN